MGVLIPEVPVVLDRPRRLIETFASLARWEEVTGLNSRRPDVMVTMVTQAAAPCPACGDEKAADGQPEGEGIDALTFACAACGHRWARVEPQENLNASQWSAYVWALLLIDDPTLDDGSPDGGDGLAEVRKWLGDPQNVARAEIAMVEMQARQMARAHALGTEGGSASEGDPPPGSTSGRRHASTSG